MNSCNTNEFCREHYIHPQPTCIPQRHTDRFAVHHNVGTVVVKDRGHVLARERVGGVGDDETRLSHGPVSHHHHFKVLHVSKFTR